MNGLGGRLERFVALGIESDDGDRIRSSGVPCPASQISGYIRDSQRATGMDEAGFAA